MGVQQFGPKKIEQISKRVGIPLDMVWNSAGATHEYEARTPDDQHLWVDTKTWKYEFIPPEKAMHMTSCRALKERNDED